MKMDGHWVNAKRDLNDSNYMSIAEWCAYITRTAGELLDKEASEELDTLRQLVQKVSDATSSIVDSFNEEILKQGGYTLQDLESAIENASGFESLSTPAGNPQTEEHNEKPNEPENL